MALQWLSTNAFFCIVNVAAAIYISGKVVHDPNDVDNLENDATYIEATMDSNSSNKTSDQQQQSSTIKKFWQGPYMLQMRPG